MKINYKNFFFQTLPFYLTFLLPAFLVTGPFLPDLAITICAIIFLINSYKNNLVIYYKNKFFIYFIIFYFYLNLSSLLSSNVIFSLQTSLTYLRFGIFALSTWHILKNDERLIKYYLYCFLIVFLFLEIDGIYQYINKENLFGYPLLQNRVSSLFATELILGSFVSRTYPLFLGLFLYYTKYYKISKKTSFLFHLSFIIAPILIFLSGERTSFFFSLISLCYIIIFLPKKSIILNSFIALFFIILGILFFESRFSDRMINQTKEQLFFGVEKDQTKKIRLFSEAHETHYKSALKIFEDNIFTGSGPKSFRLKCLEEKYKITEFSCTTHPHNTYIQLLSETGIIGFLFIFYLFFVLCLNSIKMFYNKYFLHKNEIEPIKVCLFAYSLIILWPIIPSGNFFNNWLNAIYYLPLGFFLWIMEKNKSIKNFKSPNIKF
jgi:O-antigen ligase